MKKILLIEDDAAMAKSLEAELKADNYDVVTARDGEKGFKFFYEHKPNLIILDIVLPGMNGLDLCKELRAKGNYVPIIMMTNLKEEVDKVLGLEIGADDYLTKPFSLRELKARIKVQFRKLDVNKETFPNEYIFDNISIDFRKQEVRKDEQSIELTAKEFQIVKFFIEHKGTIITRDMLLEKVWGYDSYPTTRTVDNFILTIRKKLEDEPAHPRHFLTVHTLGYKFVN